MSKHSSRPLGGGARNAPDTRDSKTQNVLLANPQRVSLGREASVSFVSADHEWPRPFTADSSQL